MILFSIKPLAYDVNVNTTNKFSSRRKIDQPSCKKNSLPT
ncbi:hypothetical protein A1OE_550 [Candidatus Endolissoclinum faulkneri L2]|uniref:Uncharacterized protein n=1 Tax=Candidatus Endolissoclinum faulkneri L2 TaxID=1193729 RepID=K7ZCN0_9PROT|nr:hypothetical protein A1OE_550 [Candidatus Endolissoclinum faulkneri L2]